MTVAIGTDLVDVARLEDRLAASPTLAARVLTARERRACQGRPASVAARWAAKEAVLKALGSALEDAGLSVPRGWRYTDIEVTSAPGRPARLALSGVAAATAQTVGVTAWHLSLSHDAGVALAFVVAQGRDRPGRQGDALTPR